MKSLLIAAAIALAAPAAFAETTVKPAAGSQCFRVSQIQNHKKADNETLYIGVRNKEVFRLGMSGACLTGTTSSDPLILETVGGTDLVCRPIDLNLKVKMGPGGVSPCIIKDITKLKPEEIAALPPKLKP